MFIDYLSINDKSIYNGPSWYRVIKMLSNTLSDLVKLNHGYSKFKLCLSKIGMAWYISFSDILKLNHSTCHDWAWQGRCGCPRASRSPWNHFDSLCLWIIWYQHVPCQFLVNITGTCSTCHSWACWGHWGCPRAPCSLQDHFESIYHWKIESTCAK